MKIIKVVAAVVSTAHVTFYTVDGKTKQYKQGTPNLAETVKRIAPTCAQGKIAEVDIDLLDIHYNPHAEYEKRSNGFTRFYCIVKQKLIDAFTPKELPTDSVEIPQTQQEFQAAALAEVMEHAVPVTPQTELPVDAAETTFIAVQEDKIIPDVQKLDLQLSRANAEPNTKGMQEFMRRLANVANKRQHSATELMNFMKRGDLPVAEDGSIIIYKILSKNTKQGLPYLDVHTKKVEQGLNCLVQMDESLVDQSRNTSCSNGLHVARRNYLGTFNGDLVTLCKVAPEDVIAVPNGEPDKMRVRAYHILFELPEEDYRTLRSGRPMETSVGKKMLADALAGNHQPANTIINIGGHMGTNITQKFLDLPAVAEPTKEDAPVESVAATVLPINEVRTFLAAPKVDVRELAKEVTAVKTRVEVMADLVNAVLAAKTLADKKTAAIVARDFKKSRKVGWSVLGVNAKNIKTIEALLSA